MLPLSLLSISLSLSFLSLSLSFLSLSLFLFILFSPFYLFIDTHSLSHIKVNAIGERGEELQ